MKKLLALLITLALATTACGSVSNVSQTSTLEDFDGQASLIVFAGTYCPHCQTSVPKIESLVWEEFGGKMNVWLQVVDGASGARFDTSMPQGYNDNISYEGVTGKSCGYVPSWALLDEMGGVIDSSCGSEKSLEDLVYTVEDLF